MPWVHEFRSVDCARPLTGERDRTAHEHGRARHLMRWQQAQSVSFQCLQIRDDIMHLLVRDGIEQRDVRGQRIVLHDLEIGCALEGL